MEQTSTAARVTAARGPYATDSRRLLNAFDHQFRGFRTFWFDRIAPAGPVVRPAAQGAELEQASVRLAGLLRRAVRSLGGDCLSRHRALGLDERLTQFYGDEEFENAYATLMGRPDVIWTASGWKFIEFNFCSSTGGQVYAHLLNELWRQLLPGPVLDTLTLADPLRDRNDVLRTVLDDLGLDPRVALVGYLPDVFLSDSGGSRRYYEIEVEVLRKAGIEAQYFDTDEFLETLASGGNAFPVVLERTVPQEWIDAGRDLDPLLRIRKCGAAVLTPQSSYQAANKQLFALLSAGQDWMTEDDRRFVDRYLPGHAGCGRRTWNSGARKETDGTAEGAARGLRRETFRRRPEFRRAHRLPDRGVGVGGRHRHSGPGRDLDRAGSRAQRRIRRRGLRLRPGRVPRHIDARGVRSAVHGRADDRLCGPLRRSGAR
ncbi:hypothetical protein [Streptomyces sp. Ac-502]|uniref:hypothetical protein n=1 Tax=Streptomyces sp. Ac-502 TaxID=3342801 RepID=UPI00386277B6